MTQRAAIERRDFADSRKLAAALSQQVAKVLVDQIDEAGSALLAVSGGTTPLNFFEALARTALPWDKVTVTVVDERFVPASSERSNERLVRERFLQGAARAARFIPFATNEPTLQAAVLATETELASIPWPPTAVILGMGADGHTASLFPNADGLAQALAPQQGARVAAVTTPAQPEPRLTLTLPALLSARYIALHIEGQAKHDTLLEALSEGPVEKMPIRAVLRGASHPLSVFWSP